MKSQFIEVKVTIEVKTEEEISYSEAEGLALHEVNNALYEQFQKKVAPPFYGYEIGG